MADVYDAAASNADDQKRQALVALAAGGTAGLQAVLSGQQQVAALRDAQLKAALADAASAPASLQSQISQRVTSPYDQTQANIAAGSASRQQDLATLTGATSAYFDQVKGSVPFARAQGQERKAKADRAAALQEREMQLREKELQMRQDALAAESADPFSKMSDSELRTRAMGAGEIDKNTEIARLQKVADEAGPGYLRGASLARIAELKAGGDLNVDRHGTMTPTRPQQPGMDSGRYATERYAREAAIAAGAGEARATGAIPLPKPSAAKAGPKTSVEKLSAAIGLSPASIDKARRSPTYGKTLAFIEEQRDAGRSSGAIRAAIKSSDAYKRYPKTLELLLRDVL